MSRFNLQEIGIRVYQILVVILVVVYVYLILPVLSVIAPMDILEQLAKVVILSHTSFIEFVLH